MDDTLGSAIAATLHHARASQGWSVATLAERAGVSRAMIGKIERGEAQPTAVLLGRLSGALGWSLSQLLARAEGDTGRVARRAAQAVWTDPGTGYVRRAVSPNTGGPLELVEVELPAGAEVAFPVESYLHAHHQIWVLDGHLVFRDDDTEHELAAGDCLELSTPRPGAYLNRSDAPCRYLVVLARR
ncbi:helix-turn-helix domain-containing protein [uncultured Jatrophihabitans sp.]|uniref:helix-turn-helix domain-containing protein n=1 Tax=uncultured Jatrophihabitans sp. TaxID=1610747 RepID=UPI0035CA3B8D